MPILKFTGLYQPFRNKSRPGEAPGTVTVGADSLPTHIHVMTFTSNKLVEQQDVSADDLPELILEKGVTWIDVTGLQDTQTLKTVGTLFGLHQLALEDVVHVHQRAKVEVFDDHLFIIARMVSLPDRLEHGTDQPVRRKGLRRHVSRAPWRLPGACTTAAPNEARPRASGGTRLSGIRSTGCDR